MPAALRAEPRELLAFVALSPLANQVSVRVLGGAWLGPFSPRDPEPLLGQVRTREVIGEVRGREDQRAVSEREHMYGSWAPRDPDTSRTSCARGFASAPRVRPLGCPRRASAPPAMTPVATDNTSAAGMCLNPHPARWRRLGPSGRQARANR